MKLARLLQVALGAGTLALAGCIAATWLVVRSQSADASTLEPFVAQIGHDLPLLRDVRVVRTRSPDVRFKPYRMIDNPQQAVSDDEPEPIALPAGTVLRFDSARLIRNGVSGNTTPFLLGIVVVSGQALAFEYAWGERRYMDGNDVNFGPPLRFIFPQAPWQSAPDPRIYVLPEP